MCALAFCKAVEFKNYLSSQVVRRKIKDGYKQGNCTIVVTKHKFLGRMRKKEKKKQGFGSVILSLCITSDLLPYSYY